MKNILKISLVAFIVFGLSSCLKDKDYDEFRVGLNPASISDKPIIEIVNGGLSNFKKQVLSADIAKTRDTNSFTISYINGGLTAPEDINVTIAYDAAALTRYNTANPSTQFAKLPDSTYTIPKTTITLKKGEVLSALVDIITFPSKIDGSKLYMLPIIITSTSSSNVIISGNNNIIYYHIIGNPLSGKYNIVGTRYNYTGSATWSGPPAPIPTNFVSTNNLTPLSPKTASALDGQAVTASFSNLGFGSGFEYGYVLTGDATFANLTLGYNTEFSSANQIKVSVITDYNYIGAGTAASPKPTFHLYTLYNNSAAGTGNDRLIDEIFTHQ
jgi:Domain of unknown function (DUF1735)